MMKTKDYLVKPNKGLNLSEIWTKPPKDMAKEDSQAALAEIIEELKTWQEKLYAEHHYGLVIVLQAMDAAGKDSMIKKVFANLNPQGVRVHSFKEPSQEELDHDYLWRIHNKLPTIGEIAIFNRSHYEDVIVTRVHDLLEKGALPEELIHGEVWHDRFRQINKWEQYLHENGFHVLKFFLHVSKEEQSERLLERIVLPEKNWKFSFSDITERRYWDDYEYVYEDMLMNTSTEYAPWYIIPADKKWFSRHLVAQVVLEKLREINPEYPELSEADQKKLAEWRDLLAKESGLKIEDLM